MFTNFVFDPARDGYDTSTWATVYGSPVVTAGKVVLSQASIQHKGDFYRGEVSFGLTIPSSAVLGGSRRIGLYSQATGSYLWFMIENGTMLAQASDGGLNTSSSTIGWSDGVVEDWTTANTKFTISWVAGVARFSINDTERAVISGASLPTNPMSVYIANASLDSMLVQSVVFKALQEFFLHTDEADSTFDAGPVYLSQSVSIAENVAVTRT